jgi:hypothetical protein
VNFYSVHGLKPREHNFQHLNVKMNHISVKTAALIRVDYEVTVSFGGGLWSVSDTQRGPGLPNVS